MSAAESIKTEAAYIKQSWLVLFLALAFGMMLVGVQLWLGPKIAENKLNETLGQIPILVEGAVPGEPVEVEGMRLFPALDGQGKVIGWVVPASDQGFADRIDLLIGLNSSLDTITGIHVLDQKETPGLGNKIVEIDWRRQFRGKRAEKPVEVIKQGSPKDHEIMSISGATISSDSVAKIVNGTVAKMRSLEAVLLKKIGHIERKK
jgi:electron transport complex protein RnfG